MSTLTVSKLADVFVGISQGSEAAKADALETASLVVVVSNEVQQSIAYDALKEISELIKGAEKSREDVKRPVIDLGKKIESLANGFKAELLAEEQRLKRLIADYQRKQIDEQRAREQAAKAEAARLESERQKAMQEARKAETEEKRTELFGKAEEIKATQQALPVAVAPVPKPEGMIAKPTWVFDVIDPAEVYKHRPDFCEVTIKRAVVNGAITGGMRQCPGLVIREEVKIR